MIIKEFLPNPVGPDKDGEYVKIFNDSDKAVNLAGWKISDASGKVFNLSGTIKSKTELVFFYSQTKISLNNSGETVFLKDSSGKLIDQLGYSGMAEEGKIIIREEKTLPNPEFKTGEVLNGDFSAPIIKIIGFDVFLGIVLGLTAVYVILQLEKKLDKNLY